MPRIHPRPDLTQELAGRLAPEQRKLLRHALECPACLAVLRQLLAATEESETLARVLVWPGRRERDYGAAIDCVMARNEGRLATILHEREAAPARVEEILRQPPGRRSVLVRNRERFRSLPVAEQLLKASRR